MKKKRVTDFSFFILKSKIEILFYRISYFIFQSEMNLEPVAAFCTTGVAMKEREK